MPEAAFVRLPLRGQRRLEVLELARRCEPAAHGVDTPLLPVELQYVNHTASTNEPDSTRQNAVNPTIETVMPNQHQFDQLDQLAERVELLLQRYKELQHTHATLLEQVSSLTQERDSLKSRLSAARARVDALIECLPENPHTTLARPAEAAR